MKHPLLWMALLGPAVGILTGVLIGVLGNAAGVGGWSRFWLAGLLTFGLGMLLGLELRRRVSQRVQRPEI